MSVVIRDNRKKFDNLLREIAMAGSSYTEVGYKNIDKKEKDHKGKATDVKVVDVAICQEFGTDRIPARPFVRTFFEENKEVLKQIVGNLYLKVISGGITTRKALGLIGEIVKAGVQKKIDSISDPPLSEATIKQKGSSKPLIDAGIMRASITHTEVIK